MENDDSKMIVKQNMLILVLSNFVMFNWMKNNNLKLLVLLERANPNAKKSIHKNPLFGNQKFPFYTKDLSSKMQNFPSKMNKTCFDWLKNLVKFWKKVF